MDLESFSIPPTVWSDRTLLSGLEVTAIAGGIGVTVIAIAIRKTRYPLHLP